MDLRNNARFRLGVKRNGMRFQTDGPGGGSDFNPLALLPAIWLDATVGLTLSTTPYSGTGTVTQTGTALVGVGTSFVNEVKVGDTLTGTNISGSVVSITDATHLTLSASNVGSGVAFTINPTAGVSDRLTTWTDQSGNGRSPTNATASQKPERRLAVQNGKPIIRTDGGNDNLAFSPTLGLPSGSWTFFAAINPPAVGSAKFVFDTQTGRLIIAALGNDQPNKVDFFDGGYHNIANAAAGFQILTWDLVSGGNGTIYRNGVSLGAAAYTAKAINGNTRIFADTAGSTGNVACDLGEFLVAPGVTVAQRVAYERYLGSKWGVAVA